jgi:hypothetical protein
VVRSRSRNAASSGQAARPRLFSDGLVFFTKVTLFVTTTYVKTAFEAGCAGAAFASLTRPSATWSPVQPTVEIRTALKPVGTSGVPYESVGINEAAGLRVPSLRRGQGSPAIELSRTVGGRACAPVSPRAGRVGSSFRGGRLRTRLARPSGNGSQLRLPEAVVASTFRERPFFTPNGVKPFAK